LRFERFAYAVVGFTILVILFGAFVRLSHSGDGCGVSWPLCQGALFPTDVPIETYIEFTHRVLSGLSFLFVLGLWFAAKKLYASTHLARAAAFYSVVFIVIEALIGAALVLFGWTGSDSSLMRGVALSIHLVNTMLLLASLSVSAFAARTDFSLDSIRVPREFWFGFGLLVGIGALGALASLAGTLFPQESFIERAAQDFSADSHLFLRLRILHPLAAMFGFFFLFRLALNHQARLFGGLLVLQMVLGLFGVLVGKSLLYTLTHLLFADLLLVAFVNLGWRISQRECTQPTPLGFHRKAALLSEQ